MGDTRVILEIREKMNLAIKDGLIRQDWTSKLIRVLSSGHFVTSARDVIWVIVIMHQIILTIENLVIWWKIVRIAIAMGSMVI